MWWECGWVDGWTRRMVEGTEGEERRKKTEVTVWQWMEGVRKGKRRWSGVELGDKLEGLGKGWKIG